MLSFRFLIMLFVISFSSFALAQGEAQDEVFKPAVIAIIEYAQIERNSKAWKSFSEQFEDVKNRYQKDIKERQDELQIQQDKLQKSVQVLTPEKFAIEEKKFRDAVSELQQKTARHKRNLDNVFNKARRQFQINIAGVATEIAKRRKIDIVLNKSSNGSTLFFWTEKLSITDEVLKIFDERFSESLIKIEDNFSE